MRFYSTDSVNREVEKSWNEELPVERIGVEKVEDVAGRNRIVLIIPFLTIVLLSISHFLGGHPWTILISLSLASLGFANLNVKRFGLIGFSLIWLLLSRLTGQRELFFPYTMFLATYVAIFLSDRHFLMGWSGGLFVVACFIAIRCHQRATFRVLVVELIVATAIVAFSVIADSLGRKTLVWRVGIVAIASLIAFCCLAI
ncbi:MAG: hypothetical protein WCH39_13950 [Schlesneria sp.]